MLSKELNERLTRVGPGTPMGKLMRHYWHPIAGSAELEHLGQSDVGLIMYRELLREQVEKVERGEEPMEVYRDPGQNACISLPQEHVTMHYSPEVSRANRATQLRQWRGLNHERFSPLRETIVEVFQEAQERAARGEQLLPMPATPVYAVGGETHKSVLLKE